MFDNLFKQFPNEEWLKAAAEMPEFTPDLWKLEQSEGQLLFCYGDMHHREVRKQRLPVNAFTHGKFSCYKSKDMPHLCPVAINTDLCTPAERARLRGSVYYVTKEQFLDLDIQRQNGLHFTRERMKIIFDSLELTRKDALKPVEVEAWVYLGTKGFWEPKLDWAFSYYRSARNNLNRDFSAVKTFKDNRSWLNTYYDWTKECVEAPITQDGHTPKWLTLPEPEQIINNGIAATARPQQEDSKAA